MNTTLPLLIQFAGLLQFIIAAANFFAPAKFRYRENLAKVSPIIRQIFTVHSACSVFSSRVSSAAPAPWANACADFLPFSGACAFRSKFSTTIPP
jgi:hypothetical protein